MKSWRTTTASILGIVGMLSIAVQAALDGNPATDPQWGVVIPAIIGIASGLFARDNKVTSEQVGAKPASPVAPELDRAA